MKKLIFLDDERVVEDVTWLDYNQPFSSITILRNYNEFVNWCNSLCPSINLDDYVFSFDHDIASFDNGKEYTGYSAVKYLCDKLLDLNIKVENIEYYTHSMNPVGKENINSYLKNFIEFMRQK